MSHRHQVDILDTSRLRLKGQFDNQVDQLLAFIRLSRTEVEGLAYLFQDVESAMQMCWTGCQVFPFGSIVTGLGIKTSDVDIFVDLPDRAKDPYASPPPVIVARKCLSRLVAFADLQAIPGAKVPILKCYHISKHRHCDINFKSYAGVRNSKLIAYLLHMDYRALPLAIIVKYWSKVHKLTGTNLMPNYTLTMMVIFYLQQVNILPPICELQRNTEEYIVDNWNTAFQEDFHFESKNRESLYVLLGGFFDYYKNFKFQEFVLSPFMGHPIPRTAFLATESLPEEYELYKTLVSNNVCKPMSVMTKICVQDPFEHARNCAAAIHARLAEKVLHFIYQSANRFQDVARDNFLMSIFENIPYQELPPNKKKNWKNTGNTTTRNTGNNTSKRNNGNTGNTGNNSSIRNIGGVVKTITKPNLQSRKPYKNAVHNLFHMYKRKPNNDIL